MSPVHLNAGRANRIKGPVYPLTNRVDDSSFVLGGIDCPFGVLGDRTCLVLPNVVLAAPVSLVGAVASGMSFCPVAFPRVLRTQVSWIGPSAKGKPVVPTRYIRDQHQIKRAAVLWLFDRF